MKILIHKDKNTVRRASWVSLAAGLAVMLSQLTPLMNATAVAGTSEQAKRIHDRLTGVPPTLDTLNQMITYLEQNTNGGIHHFFYPLT